MAKNLQNSNFLPLKLEAKNENSHLLGQYCCAHSRQISDWLGENREEAYWIWKKELMDAGRLCIG